MRPIFRYRWDGLQCIGSSPISSTWSRGRLTTVWKESDAGRSTKLTQIANIIKKRTNFQTFIPIHEHCLGSETLLHPGVWRVYSGFDCAHMRISLILHVPTASLLTILIVVCLNAATEASDTLRLRPRPPPRQKAHLQNQTSPDLFDNGNLT